MHYYIALPSCDTMLSYSLIIRHIPISDILKCGTRYTLESTRLKHKLVHSNKFNRYDIYIKKASNCYWKHPDNQRKRDFLWFPAERFNDLQIAIIPKLIDHFKAIPIKIHKNTLKKRKGITCKNSWEKNLKTTKTSYLWRKIKIHCKATMIRSQNSHRTWT